MVLPLREEGMSKVRDLIPIIFGWLDGVKQRRRGLGVTLEARADGSLAVPKSSVAFARSTSFTFW